MSAPRRGRSLTRFTAALAAAATLSLTVPVAASGAVPDQHVEPATGVFLTQRMGALFHDIVNDSLPRAQSLFFPQGAYVAMKSHEIPYPAADYADRLVAFLRLDLVAYHSFVLAHGPATFLGVNVNPAQAAWVAPGSCENSIGYWHLPGVRLVYSSQHVVRSVAVASLISWHGVWYVVHLGPNPRPVNVGTVDAPGLGRGVAGPAGGC